VVTHAASVAPIIRQFEVFRISSTSSTHIYIYYNKNTGFSSFGTHYDSISKKASKSATPFLKA
jgi:ribosomal protein L16 Arg81 hydroxylase